MHDTDNAVVTTHEHTFTTTMHVLYREIVTSVLPVVKIVSYGVLVFVKVAIRFHILIFLAKQLLACYIRKAVDQMQ